MTVRCSFPDHTGDPAVFGVCRDCNPEPEPTPPPRDLERPYEQVLDADERGGH